MSVLWEMFPAASLRHVKATRLLDSNCQPGPDFTYYSVESRHHSRQTEWRLA